MGDRSDEVASIINSMLPDLTQQVQEEQRAIVKQELEKRLAAERYAIKQRFDKRIEEEAGSINSQLAGKLAEKRGQLRQARQRLERAKQGQIDIAITESEKQRFIDETIREIASSGILSDVRQSLMSKIWSELQKQYEKRMSDELDEIRRDLQAAYNERKKAKRQYYSQNIERSIKQKVDKLQSESSNIDQQRDSIKNKVEDCRAARESARHSYQQMAERYTQQIGKLRDSISAARSH